MKSKLDTEDPWMDASQRQQVSNLLMEAGAIVASDIDTGAEDDGALVTRTMLVIEYLDADGDTRLAWHRPQPGFSINDLALIGKTLGDASLVSWIEDTVRNVVRDALNDMREGD